MLFPFFLSHLHLFLVCVNNNNNNYTRTLLIMYALHITSLLHWPCLDFRAYFVATSASCQKRLRRLCGSKVAFYGSTLSGGVVRVLGKRVRI